MPTDRIQEIRARLDAAQMELIENLLFGRANSSEATAFITEAPHDIAWLLDEVERLRGPVDTSRTLSRRYATKAERDSALVAQRKRHA